MFPTAHSDIMVELANARIAELQAAAERYRRARPFLASRRKARSLEPAADLSSVSPAPAAETTEAGRAA